MRTNITRRELARNAGLTSGLAVLGLLPKSANAEAGYPNRDVRIIVAQAPGSAVDISARLLASSLSEVLKRQFYVEDKPGAGQNIGTEIALHAPRDGYTLLQATAANTTNASLYENLTFNFVKDIAPIGGMVQIPNVMIISPSLPVSSVADFITYAKSRPGKLNMASSGNGTTPHLAGELFKKMAGIEMTNIPYRGSTPALTDIIAGRVDVMFDVLGPSVGQIKDGAVRALAITTKKRSNVLPNLPCISDTLPDYEVSSWNGLVAPAGTPEDIIKILASALERSLDNPTLLAKLADFGGTPLRMGPQAFAEFIRSETDKWGKVIKDANIKPD